MLVRPRNLHFLASSPGDSDSGGVLKLHFEKYYPMSLVYCIAHGSHVKGS